MDLGVSIWQVQKHLQLRIEAQGKYMQSILEKAYQTLAGENMASAATNLKGTIVPHQGIPDMGVMKEFGSPLGFSSFQDLENIYGGDQIDLQHNMEKPPLDHGFMPINESLCLGKKRSNNPYSGSGKSPLIWSDDLRLQDLGGPASSCLGPQDDPFKGDQIQIAPPGSLDRGTSNDIDHMSDIYDSKPVLQGETVVGEKKFDASMKLERPSPRRAPLQAERMSPMISTGGRGSPFG